MANVELSRPHRSARTLALLFLAGLAALGLMLLARPEQPPPRPVEVVLAAAPAPPPVVPRVEPAAQPSAERPGAEKPKVQQAEPRKIAKRSFGGCKDRH